MRLTILNKGLLIIALPLLCQVGFTFVYANLITDATAALKKGADWQEVLTLADQTSSNTQKALTFSILAGIEGTEEARERQRKQMRKTIALVKQLKAAMVKPSVKAALHVDPNNMLDSKEGIKRMLMGMMMLQRQNIDRELSIRAAFTSAGVQPQVLLANLQARQQSETRAYDIVSQAQERIKKEQAAFDKKSKEIDLLANQVLFANAAIAILLAAVFFFDISGRIFRVRKNIKLLSEHKFPESPKPGSDEIADLDKSVHKCAEEIHRLTQFKGQMLGVVSHELKTPLRTIHGVITMLSADAYGQLSEKAKEHCQRAQRNLERLIRLVNDLLALEQMEGQGFKLNPSSVSLSALVHDSFNAVESLASARKIQLRWNSEEHELIADGQRILQVMINLLSNAIKFSNEDSTVSVESRLKEKDILEISVSNTGREIPQEKRNKIFQRFGQLEASDGSSKGGSGLGLTITKTIIEQHNGEIGFDSDAKETRFWFRLPLIYIQKMKPELASIPKPSSKSHFGLLQRGLILVGLPLAINLLFLLGLKQIWYSVENSLAKTRRLSEASAQMFLVSGSAVNNFWANALVGDSVDTEMKDLCKRQSEFVTKDLIELRKMAKKMPGFGLDEAVKNVKNLTADSERLSSGKEPSIKELQQNGLFNACTHAMETVAKIAAGQQSVITKEHKSQVKAIERMQSVLLAVPTANILLSIILAIFYAKSISSRLLNVTINSSCLARKQPLLPPLSGEDEIADLDRYFHDAATQLLKLDEFKEQMIAVASHELRTPLSALLFSFNLLESGAFGELSEKAHDRICIAEEESTKLIRLINNLLDMEKLQVGKMELAISPGDLSKICSKSIESVKHEAESAGVEIESDAAELILNCDSERVVQALVNILSNAIKQSPRGSRVVLSASQKENLVELSVSDQGKGFSPERQNKLFSQAQKLDAEDYELGGSTLGLSLSKWLVELHGGKISLQSEEGKGSTFSCLFPGTVVADPKSAGSDPGSAGSDPGSAGGSPASTPGSAGFQPASTPIENGSEIADPDRSDRN